MLTMVLLQLTSNISRASMSSLSPSAEDIVRLVLCTKAMCLQTVHTICSSIRVCLSYTCIHLKPGRIVSCRWQCNQVMM